MIFRLIVPLVLIFACFSALTYFLIKNIKTPNKAIEKIELYKYCFCFIIPQIGILFVPMFFEKIFFKEYHFGYLFLSSLFVFIAIANPIYKLREAGDKEKRIILAFLGSLIAVNLTEFDLFSVFSLEFSAWTVYYAWAIMTAVLFAFKYFWDNSSTRKKIVT